MTFKIRFNSIDNGGQSLNGVCGSFARKSPSKQNRDKTRATSFRPQGVVTRSQHNENLEESIVEKPKADITSEDKTYFFSPCHVNGDQERQAMDCNHASPLLPAIINNTPPIMTPPGNSNTDISQVINASNVRKQSEVMHNDHKCNDTTTEEDSMIKMCHMVLTSCHRNIINLVLMVVVLDKNVISIISVRGVTVDAGYVMNVTKRVPTIDKINGLKKRILPDQ